MKKKQPMLFSFSSFEYFYMPKILKVFYLRILLKFILPTVVFLRQTAIHITTILLVIATAHNIYAQSALSDGTWAKISISESGIYKISYDDLHKWGFSDIESVAIYGNGAGEKTLINQDGLPDTLHQIATSTIRNEQDSYVLFYGQSPDTWTFDKTSNSFIPQKNSLNDKNYYYITVSRPTSEIKKSSTTLSATITSNSYDYITFYEKDETNPISSGRTFFESIPSSKTISFNAPHVRTQDTATLTVAFAARHSTHATTDVTANGTTIGTMTFSATTNSKPYARLQTKSFSFIPKERNTIDISPNYYGANSRSYLNYVSLQARCDLKIDGTGQLLFRDTKTIQEHGVCTYSIASNAKQTVWDITDPDNPVVLPTTYSSGSTTFTADCSTLHEFIAFSKEFKSVEFEKIVENQDILSNTDIDMLIITTPIFESYAQQLAMLHANEDNLSSTIVMQEAICTEFSAGRKQVTSIRDYIRYVYIKSNKRLKYVLLFGDGTFNNAEIDINGPYILTFQTKESLHDEYSLCSDDFFALLDTNEGVKDNDTFVGNIDVAIGRIPVTSKTDAEVVTKKIIQYTTNPQYRGDWQNYLCFLADDANENQTMHMADADQLCTTIAKMYPQFNFDKIYADAYTQVRSSAGERYPDVVNAINDRIQKGCLIFNYSGHGNETRMMAEYAVDANSIESWKNTTKLPFFIAAACNIAHFDYDGTSLGEKLLTQNNGGGIGIISATRYSYASANYTLCDNIYKYIFELDSTQRPSTIGEALLKAKANVTSDIYQNKRLYTLLGDPALRLAVPEYSIIIDSINHISIEEFTDTLRALSTFYVSGHINTPNNIIDSTFNGTLSIKLFDKPQTISTLGNDGNDIFTFDSYSNILFQGYASVQNGTFSFSSIVPLDIYYYNGNGNLNLYATNGKKQASGAYYSIPINGSLTSENDDFSGPSVTIYLNDSTFTEGLMTNQNPTIYISIKDSSGVNISEASIGHNITLTIDNDETNQITLNDFYYADLNTFVSGNIRYQLRNLDEGQHSLSVIVWDIYNNSSETTISFNVVHNSDVTLQNVYNYPNPMNNTTHFHFEHNQADVEMDVTITIYDLTGNIVRKITAEKTTSGFIEDELTWDGKTSGGVTLQNGIYPYKITIKTSQGEQTIGDNKLLLLK